MTGKLVSFAWWFGMLMLTGCTSVSEIRTHHGTGGELPVISVENPSADCKSAASTPASRANSIEDYGNFWAGYVEFDDEGWMFRSSEPQNQLQALQSRLARELKDASLRDTDFLVVAFVHGWHHNAHDDDCNVHEFRAMLKVADQRYAEAYSRGLLAHRRRIVGIYVGWRGESIDIDNLNATTVLDRRNAAERVAKGDVRQLFATIRKLQIGESLAPDQRADRMRTVVVGHSFGGLIAFHGMSPAVLNELTLTKPEAGAGGCRQTVYRPAAVVMQDGKLRAESAPTREAQKTAPVFPDMLVLINPAFEATRFESLHALMQPSPDPNCVYPEDRPKVVVVTADNDFWTGPAFTAGRRVLTLLEAYPSGATRDAERDANTHAIGFTARYQTHRLCLQPAPGADGTASGGRRAAAALTEPAAADWKPLDRFAPVWVVRTDPTIVDGHNGFLFAKPDPALAKQVPHLLNWLIDLHTFGPGDGSPAMTSSCSPP